MKTKEWLTTMRSVSKTTMRLTFMQKMTSQRAWQRLKSPKKRLNFSFGCRVLAVKSKLARLTSMSSMIIARKVLKKYSSNSNSTVRNSPSWGKNWANGHSWTRACYHCSSSIIKTRNSHFFVSCYSFSSLSCRIRSVRVAWESIFSNSCMLTKSTSWRQKLSNLSSVTWMKSSKSQIDLRNTSRWLSSSLCCSSSFYRFLNAIKAQESVELRAMYKKAFCWLIKNIMFLIC